MKKDCQENRRVCVIACLAMVLELSGSAWAAEKPEVFLQLGHAAHVTSVAFSPNGKYVLSGSGDNSLKLWDVSSGKEIRLFQGHTSNVESVAFSPNGKYALSGSYDTTLKLWDITTGKEIQSFKGHSHVVCSVAFSPDGRYALSGSWDKTLKLWEVSSGKEIRSFQGHLKRVSSVAFSLDGRYLLSGSLGDNAVKLWDVSSGKEIHSFQGHSNYVGSVAFSPDVRYALSGSSDKILKLWDVSLGKEIRSFKGHLSEISSVAFSPDGKLALSGSRDNTLKLWSVATGKEIRTFTGHSNRVYSVAFSPDNRYALSGSSDRTLKLWDISSGKEVHTFQSHSNQISSVALSPDGKFVLCGSEDKSIKLCDVYSGKIVRVFEGHSDAAGTVAFSPDGKLALSGSLDKSMKLWNVDSGKVLHTFYGHSEAISSVAFSPNGKLALSGSNDKTMKLWEVSSGKEVLTFQAAKEELVKKAREMELAAAIELLRFQGHHKAIYSVAFSPDGKFVLSGGEDTTIKLWDSVSGNVILTMYGDLKREVYSVGFSPDGESALSGSEDGTMKLWDVSSGRELRMFQGKSSKVISAKFSPDGQYVLSGRQNNTLKLYDFESGQEIRNFEGHSGSVHSVAFSPDGKLAVSGSGDFTTRIWNIDSGKEICRFIFFKDGEWLAITPENYYNASVNGDKYLNVRIGNNVYGIDQYKAKYYRPDIVQLALKLGDTPQAIAQLKGDTEGLKASEQPPKVWFVSPSDRYETDKPFIEVQVKTEDIADIAESVTFKVNQRILATEKKPVRPVSEGAKVREFSRQVPLIPGENFIEAEARGRAGATQTAMILVIRRGAEKKLPALWYFGVGVSKHSISEMTLTYPAKDVTGLADALKRQKGRAYSEVNIRTLTDAEASRGNIMDSIESFFSGAKLEDVAILFVSGHGMNSASGYHFIAHDTNPDRMSSTGVSGEFFNNVLKTVKSNVLLFADTCHSGNITGNENWKNQANADTNDFLRRAADNGVFVFASSSGASVSREDPSWGHGAFAKALIDGILGEAAYRENQVKLSFLQDYVRTNVMKLTENAQQPVIPKLDGTEKFLDLVLAKKG